MFLLPALDAAVARSLTHSLIRTHSERLVMSDYTVSQRLTVSAREERRGRTGSHPALLSLEEDQRTQDDADLHTHCACMFADEATAAAALYISLSICLSLASTGEARQSTSACILRDA